MLYYKRYELVPRPSCNAGLSYAVVDPARGAVVGEAYYSGGYEYTVRIHVPHYGFVEYRVPAYSTYTGRRWVYLPF